MNDVLRRELVCAVLPERVSVETMGSVLRALLPSSVQDDWKMLLARSLNDDGRHRDYSREEAASAILRATQSGERGSQTTSH